MLEVKVEIRSNSDGAAREFTLLPEFFHETASPTLLLADVIVEGQTVDRVALRVNGSTGKIRLERRMEPVAPKIERIQGGDDENGN